MFSTKPSKAFLLSCNLSKKNLITFTLLPKEVSPTILTINSLRLISNNHQEAYPHFTTIPIIPALHARTVL